MGSLWNVDFNGSKKDGSCRIKVIFKGLKIQLNGLTDVGKRIIVIIALRDTAWQCRDLRCVAALFGLS